jgi:hypothetical protein
MNSSILIFHWLPRVIGIAAILFISIFALDAFEPGLTIWQQLGHFFMHLIPSFVLLIILLLAWKWERAGGIIFIMIGLGFSPLIFMINYNRNHFPFWTSVINGVVVAMPFAVVGILFLVSAYKKKKSVSTGK